MFRISHIQQTQTNQSVSGSYNPSHERKSKKICPATYPPLFHPVNNNYKVTRADEMTIDETAMWIWTYGHFAGWEEAEIYSISFKENNISGELLPMVTAELMRNDLNITNANHRSVIKSVISLLFADKEKGYSSPRLFPKEHKVLECQQKRKFSDEELASDCDSIMDWRSSRSSIDMSESCDSSCFSTISRRSSSSGVSSMKRPWKANENTHLSRQLILKLLPEQRDFLGLIELLEKKFAEQDYNVLIKRSETKDKCFTVDFKDRCSALHALAEAEIIGYKLSKSRPRRPSPSFPVRFKALRELTIRKGKALRGEKIGKVMNNEVITVNQVKGRRARIVVVQDGNLVNCGWVSLHTTDGDALLERLEVANE